MAAGTVDLTTRQNYNSSKGSHFFYSTTSAPYSQGSILLYQDVILLEERPAAPNVETIHLSPKNFQALSDMATNPPEPNEALIEIFKEYERDRGM